MVILHLGTENIRDELVFATGVAQNWLESEMVVSSIRVGCLVEDPEECLDFHQKELIQLK